MPKGEHVIKTYLDALKEARQEDMDDYDAADAAAEATIAKHGKLPEEGK